MLLTDKKISIEAFANNDSVDSVSFSSSVKHIGSKAFYKCSNLTSVSFENYSKMISIGSYAFYKINVESLTIPDSVKLIGPFAFAFCKNLKYVYFSENSQIQVIREGAFRGCRNMVKIILPSRHVKIERYALNFDDDMDEEKKLKFLIEKYRNMPAKKEEAAKDNETIVSLENLKVYFYERNYTASDAKHSRRPHWYKKT